MDAKQIEKVKEVYDTPDRAWYRQTFPGKIRPSGGAKVEAVSFDRMLDCALIQREQIDRIDAKRFALMAGET